MTKHYETMFILKPTLSEEEAAAKVTQFEELITKNGGEVVATEKIGVKPLAYPIEKFERGNYTVIYYTGDGQLNKELDRVYGITEDVLRHIVIKYERKVEVAAWQNMVSRAKGEAHKEVKLSETSREPRGGPRGGPRGAPRGGPRERYQGDAPRRDAAPRSDAPRSEAPRSEAPRAEAVEAKPEAAE